MKLRLARVNERVEFEDQGNRVILKLLSGSLEDDDFDDVVSAIDLLLEMMMSTKFRSKFDMGKYRSKIDNVKKRFDDVIEDIKEDQNKVV